MVYDLAIEPMARSVDPPRVSPLQLVPGPGERSLANDRSPSSSGRGPAHNLPQPLTSFVGRAREVAEARELLGTTRLLTLTGAGGIGKTRLGHEVAATLLDEFPDGVRLVDLTALADPTLVPHAVAMAFGLRETPERPILSSLIDALDAGRLLLVLDSCEHLIDACAALADALLRACPRLRILATSRQPLGIAGETTYRVPALSLPPDADEPSPLTAGRGGCLSPGVGPASHVSSGPVPAESDAVRLFVERAQAAVPAFALAERNVQAVEQICRQLDGIPLAIELAAARVAVISPEQIADRLRDRFRLLTGGSRSALPRYRTLRATIDWSFDLLDDAERTLLRRLAVFAGGWSLEAAESICADEALAPDDVLDLLSGLVAKSLVLADEHPEGVRYRLLESLRAYAEERLAEAGETNLLRMRHRDWFVALAERAEPELAGTQQGLWLARLDAEYDNLRAALAWSVELGEIEPGLRLAASLLRFWLTRGRFREGHRWLAELLQRPDELPGVTSSLQMQALEAAGRLAAKHGDYEAAEAFLSRAVEVARAHDDQSGLAAGLHGLGCLARVRGDHRRARTILHGARALFELLGDTQAVAETSICLGVVACSTDDLSEARRFFEASLTTYRTLGNSQGVAVALSNLGEVALELGDLAEASALERESLSLATRIGDRERVAVTLTALAGVAAASGQAERALRLAGAAMQLRDAIGKTSPAAWRARSDRWLMPARRLLGAEASADAYAAGRAMPLADAIQDALGVGDPSVHDAPPASAQTAPDRHPPHQVTVGAIPPRNDAGPLTPREVEVAALVARGFTNRQIADELVIAEGTAANHVKHILTRLVLDSRVQIATWAVAKGLLSRAAS
ncbi:MAG: tetratricopeptide repeat protein [Chloroflexota bacterium]